MPFNYEFSNDRARKWKCFICGKDHAAWDDFKKHVRESHEEGREFVVCPLARCQAPVRDLAMHYRAKHPTAKLPKERQERAVIWKDYDKKADKIKGTKKPKYREGNFVSNKMGKELHYRSGFECEVYECLEVLPDVTKFEAEPFAVPYLFEEGGRPVQHDYYPDLRVHWSDGRIEVWEIKPSKQTTLPRNEAKWKAAAKYCKTRGWDFIVMTEKGLAKLRKRVRETRLTAG
jgi:hypothetical protein